MDYQQLLGVKQLAETAWQGRGAKIAILDSGTPHIYLHGGYPYRTEIGRPGRDSYGHATEIASILFGCPEIVGICPKASVFYVKVLDDQGNGSIKSVVSGLKKALDSDVDIINLSLGFMRTEVCPRSLEKICRKVADAGKTIVCAAGNDGGRVNWPAALPTTLAIGSVGTDGLKAAFSSAGEVDFLAPGINLCVRDAGGTIRHVSGTSFSAALVTGFAALLVAEMKAKGMLSEPQNVRAALRAYAQDVGKTGWDEESGYGVLSARTMDATVEQKIDVGFFDRIVGKIQGLLGLGKKGVQNGSV